MSVHGGNIEEVARMYKFNPEEIVDFSANINPMGLSENVKKAMINSIDKVIKYPDITYFDLKNSISNFEDINSQNIILGNGAAEAIFNIVRALKPKKALLPAPTFSEYEEAILSVNGEIKYQRYTCGQFVPAYKKSASFENERHAIGVQNDKMRVLVIQVAGLLARRIVSWVTLGHNLKQGECYGMIKFGSSTELVLPKNVEILVKKGDSVVGGVSLIGRVH